jgi:hypothetical protein
MYRNFIREGRSVGVFGLLLRPVEMLFSCDSASLPKAENGVEALKENPFSI